jgi:hypothetical protein
MNPEEIIIVAHDLAPAATKAAEETAAKLWQCADLSVPPVATAAHAVTEPIAVNVLLPDAFDQAKVNEWLSKVLGPQKLATEIQAQGQQNLSFGCYNEEFLEPGKIELVEPGKMDIDLIARKQRLDILIRHFSDFPIVRCSAVEDKTVFPRPTIEWASDHPTVVIRPKD